MEKQKNMVHRRPFADSVIVCIVAVMTILVPAIAMGGITPMPSQEALQLSLEREAKVSLGAKMSGPSDLVINTQYRLIHGPVSMSAGEEQEELGLDIPGSSLPVAALLGQDGNPWLEAEEELGSHVMRYLEEQCVQQKVPVALALAVIEAESHFQADVVSPTQDYGLMQINAGPDFAYHAYYKELLGVEDMTDPYDNITTGVYMLGKDLAQYNGNVELTLMSYHLGTTGAERKWASGVRSTYATQKQLKNYYKYLAQAAL